MGYAFFLSMQSVGRYKPHSWEVGLVTLSVSRKDGNLINCSVSANKEISQNVVLDASALPVQMKCLSRQEQGRSGHLNHF